MALLGPTSSGKSSIARQVASAAGWPVPSEDRPGPDRAIPAADRVPARADPVCAPAPDQVSDPGVELVSVDSMAVYRGMDVGTAKPSVAVRSAVPYHLVDLVDPAEEFTVRRFQAAARAALAAIAGRRRAALLVGGTGLYLRAVVDGLSFPGRYPGVAAELERTLEATGDGDGSGPAYRTALADLHLRLTELDPVAASRIEPTNRRRLVRALEVCIGSGRPFSAHGPGLDHYRPTDVRLVGLRVEQEVLDRRIAERFNRLLAAGFLDEVAGLAAPPRRPVEDGPTGTRLPRAARPRRGRGTAGGGRGRRRPEDEGLRPAPDGVVSP